MPPETLTRIEISKEYLNFSAGHFTIFSATERENLHGHNFQVRCAVTAAVGADGLAFDYVLLKRVLRELCDALDERVLLPEQSPYLTLEHRDGMVIALLRRRAHPLPGAGLPAACRSAMSPLKNWPACCSNAAARPAGTGAGWAIRAMEIGVSSGSGQWAFSHWESA